MFQQRSALIAGLVSFSALAAHAQSTRCYNRESLRGPWAAVVNYAQNLALGLVTESFDGAGNLTTTFLIDQPKAGSTTGEREIVTGTQTGNYILNCDGTGTMTRVVTRQDGSTANQADDLVVTDGFVQGSRLAASAMADAVRIPSVVVPGGVYLTINHTQLPDTPNRCFTAASLQGSYAEVATFGNDLASALGSITMDGAGSLAGTFLVNQPKADSTTGERAFVSGTERGVYTVNCNGTGLFTRSVTTADGKTSSNLLNDFLITRASVRNGQLIATQIVDAQRVPSVVVPGGAFVVRTLNLLPNAQAGPGLVGSAQ